MDEIFTRILDISIAICWIVPAVLIARLLLKKAPKWIACLLWVVVALRLLLPVSIQSDLSLVPDRDELSYNVTGAVTLESSVVSTAPAEPEETNRILYTVAIVWASGTLAMLLYSGISYLRIHRRVRINIPAGDGVYLCDDVDSPFVLGVLRPRIYTPSGIDPTAMQYVLAHEKAHIHRKDHWWKPLGFVLLSFYWFHPLLWLAYILLCRDIEGACDEKVIREMDNAEKKGYLEALVACSVHRRMIMTCPVAFGEVGVKTRVRNIINYRKPGFWIMVASLVVCSVTAVCFLTDPKPCEHMQYGTVTQEPTCTDEGVRTYSCEQCRYTYREDIPKLTHAYSAGKLLEAPTCTREGIEEFTCTCCDDTVEVTLEKLPHTPGTMTIARRPTCTDTGEKIAACTGCGEICAREIMATVKIHTMEETRRKAATCQEAGEIVRTCKYCDLKDVQVLEKLPHNIEVLSVREANCRKPKEVATRCTECKMTWFNTVGEPAWDQHSGFDAGGGYWYCGVCGCMLKRPNKETYSLFDSLVETGTKSMMPEDLYPVIKWDISDDVRPKPGR